MHTYLSLRCAFSNGSSVSKLTYDVTPLILVSVIIPSLFFNIFRNKKNTCSNFLIILSFIIKHFYSHALIVKYRCCNFDSFKNLLNLFPLRIS